MAVLICRETYDKQKMDVKDLSQQERTKSQALESKVNELHPYVTVNSTICFGYLHLIKKG